MSNKRSYILLLILVLSLVIGYIYFESKLGNEINQIEEQKFIAANGSDLFNYDYRVNINSNTDGTDYISINFIIDIYPKTDEVYEKVLATAYISDRVQEAIAIKSYDSFGVAENEPLSMNRNDENNKGISIARGTWLYKDTDIDKLVDELERGIDVELIWENGAEYVHIQDVQIEIHDSDIKQ